MSSLLHGARYDYRPFHGNDLGAWIQHFGFDLKMREALEAEDLGVSNVRDLKYVYDDEDLLETVRQNVSALDFRKFLDIRALTNPQTNPQEILYTERNSESTAPAPFALPTAFSTSSSSSLTVDENVDPELESENGSVDALNAASMCAAIRVPHSSSLDVAILLDCTGSMAAHIDTAKIEILAIMQSIRIFYPSISLRVAFVGYHGQGRLTVQPFTTSVDLLSTVVMQQQCSGDGSDCCLTDVIGGLERACSLDWMSETRTLCHVGVLPGGAGELENLSIGDPRCNKLQALLQDLRVKLDVQYQFGKINDSTDRMVEQFNLLAGAPAPYVRAVPMQARAFMSIVTEGDSNSVPLHSADSESSTGHTSDGGQVQHGASLDLSSPMWRNIPSEEAVRFPMTIPQSIAGLTHETEDCCVIAFPDASTVTIKMALEPFAKSEQRAAHYGQMINHAAGSCNNIIIKNRLAALRTKHDCEQLLECHRAGKFLAVEFNKIKPHGCPSVRYVDAHILQLITRWPEQPFVLCEDQIPGHFEKFNSNTGYCAPNPTYESGVNHDAVQAFSHWTYCVTNDTMMVVDCQGAFDPQTNSFLLTDPAVHSTSVLRFGRSNLAKYGFSSFFGSHQCNQCCRAMGLPRGMGATAIVGRPSD